MSRISETTVNVEAKLALNKFNVDEGHPHIELVDEPDDAEFDKLVLCCPAGLYRRNADGTKKFDHAGCLECGTCRILCGGTIVRSWAYPEPTMGVQYRFG